jgi:hypothetical protein
MRPLSKNVDPISIFVHLNDVESVAAGTTQCEEIDFLGDILGQWSFPVPPASVIVYKGFLFLWPAKFTTARHRASTIYKC